MANQKLMLSTAWYTFGNLLVRFFNFLLLPIYSNLIPTEHFGKYSLLISLTVIALAFYQFGLPSGLSKFYIEESNPDKKRIIFSTSINILLINSILISVIVFIFSSGISNWLLNDKTYANLLALLFVVLIIDTISTQILQLMKTLEEAKKVVTYTALGAIINILMNLLFVVHFKFGIWGIVISQAISSTAVLIFLIPLIRIHYHFVIDKNIAKSMILFCIPIIIAGVFNYGIDVIDRFILNIYYGQKEVGIYSFSYRIAMVMNLFVISFRTAWIPHSLNLFHSRDFKESFGKTFSKLLGAGLSILVIGTLLSDDLFKISFKDNYLFNSSYADGAVIIPFILLGYLFNGIATFYFVYPLTENRSKHFIYADGLGLLVNIIANLLLIPKLGMIGAAAATTLSYIATSAYLFGVSKNKITVVYQRKQIVELVLLTIAITVAGLMLKFLITDLILIVIFVLVATKMLNINIFQIFKNSIE
jgi:O-antigen/teichoic acid export membrane protein